MKKLFSICLLCLFFIGTFLTVNALSSYEKFIPDSFTYDINVTYPFYSYGELYNISDVVVSGTVISIGDASWSTKDSNAPNGIVFIEGTDENGPYIEYSINLSPNEVIYTDFVFYADDVYKGNLKENELIVRSFGGTVDGFTMKFDSSLDSSNYQKGDQILLFLMEDIGITKDLGSKHYTIVTPRGQLISENGIFINENGEKLSINDLIPAQLNG
ncbi:MAG: hypothetical protein LBU81_04360 [Methanosarcinales archaeon]|jgi:hypothetical protein|nr:hypothetical protein [Methanosarcinales archaeon]